jgi:hypothetical protein
MIATNELKITWKEAIVSLFYVLPWQLAGGTEENHDTTEHR